MVMQLIPVIVGLTVAIVVVLALFSVFPDLMANFACKAIGGDTDGDFVEDAGENFTDTASVVAWKQSCNSLQTQTTIVPVLIGLAIVIGAILIIMRLFGG